MGRRPDYGSAMTPSLYLPSRSRPASWVWNRGCGPHSDPSQVTQHFDADDLHLLFRSGTVQPHPFPGGERPSCSMRTSIPIRPLKTEAGKSSPRSVNLNDRGNQLVGDGSCHDAALFSSAQSLQLSPDAPQVRENLTHFTRWDPPNVSISDQGLRSFRFKPKDSSSASFGLSPLCGTALHGSVPQTPQSWSGSRAGVSFSWLRVSPPAPYAFGKPVLGPGFPVSSWLDLANYG